MDPVTALRQIAYYKDRAREDPRRVMAYRNAADVVEALTDAQRERLGASNGWQSLPGVGPKTAKVIAQAWAGREPDTLVELRSAAEDLGGVTCVRRCAVTCTCTRTGPMDRPRSRR